MSENEDRAIQPPGGIVGEVLAEAAGTMILILFGTGVVAQVVAGGIGDHDSIAWSWGLGVTLGVYVAGRISGAHLNPAVTIALAAFQGFEWRKVGPYIGGQFVGAFVAALIVRWNYTEVIHKMDPGHTLKTQGIFSTLPGNGNAATGVHEFGALRDQIIGTAILVFLILAITSVRATPPLANLAPVVIGLLVVAIGMAWGTNAGYAINPARDLGPRLAEWLTGYSHAWSDQYGNQYWWVPVVGPIIGGLVGGALYKYLIENYLPAQDEAGGGPAEVGELPETDTSRRTV